MIEHDPNQPSKNTSRESKETISGDTIVPREIQKLFESEMGGPRRKIAVHMTQNGKEVKGALQPGPVLVSFTPPMTGHLDLEISCIGGVIRNIQGGALQKFPMRIFASSVRNPIEFEMNAAGGYLFLSVDLYNPNKFRYCEGHWHTEIGDRAEDEKGD